MRLVVQGFADKKSIRILSVIFSPSVFLLLHVASQLRGAGITKIASAGEDYFLKFIETVEKR